MVLNVTSVNAATTKVYDQMKNNAVNDDIRSDYVDSDTGIDFSLPSSNIEGAQENTNGKASERNIQYEIYHPRTFEKLNLDICSNDNIDIIITIEELAELQQALTKALRGKLNSDNILEEVCDIELCLIIIKKIYNITPKKLNKAKYIKLKRLIERTNNGDFK